MNKYVIGTLQRLRLNNVPPGKLRVLTPGGNKSIAKSMTCKYDNDIQCFSDCPECVRARDVVICTGCQQTIGSCEDCYTLNDEIYCSDCIEDVVEDIFHNMPLSEKLEIAGANRMMWEG